jgi:hypothetical protein
MCQCAHPSTVSIMHIKDGTDLSSSLYVDLTLRPAQELGIQNVNLERTLTPHLFS